MISSRYLYKAKKKNWRDLPKDQCWTQGYLFDNDYSGEEQRFFVGSLVIDDYVGMGCDEWDINGTNFYEIDPTTICQCVGFEDKNGNVIFEHDILKGFFYPYKYDDEHNYYGLCSWIDESKAFMIYTIKNPESDVNGISHGNTELMEGWNPAMWEIIGNEFDNPELLGE